MLSVYTQSQRRSAHGHPLPAQAASKQAIVPTLCLLILLNVYTPALNAAELAPEFEADRLLLATEQALSANAYTPAQGYLNEITKLGVKPPNEYYYFLGRVLANQSQYDDAVKNFTRYVNNAGKKARFYHESLTAITELEQHQHASAPTNHQSQRLQWGGVIDGQTDEQYTQRLLKLYKTQQDITALSRHINSLLKFYALPNSANSTIEPSGYYQLNVRGSRIATVLLQDPDANTEQRAAKITGYQFSVYGINPYMKATCGKSLEVGQACWFNKPESSEPWLVLQANLVGATELEKALSVLIKTIQRNS